jgi:hypothetical protein
MSDGDDNLARLYLADVIAQFRKQKELAERALARVSDEHLTATLDPESNSIAVLVQHMAGNLRSRWTDFLTTDGEKPDRKRDSEFMDPPPRDTLMKAWEDGWQLAFTSLGELSDEDLTRTVTIRGEKHSVLQAINRQLTHTAYHCGQIVLLAKHFNSADWKPLSVPRGESEEFNRKVRAGEASQR